MDKNDCFYLGEIKRPHGIKGEVAVSIDADNPERYAALDSVFLENNGLLVPYFIENIRITKNNEAIIHFEDITPEDAENLTGAEMYLPLSLLPPLSGNKFYYHEVAGFTVRDKHAGEIGTIKQVLDMPMQAILQVIKNDREILIPVTDETIVQVDRQNSVMHVNLPEGLLDIYL